MNKIAITLAGLLAGSTLFAQTVFTYGKHAVPKEEFVRAFNKNPNNTGDRKAAIKDYLGLYTNFKLKVQAAYDAGLNKDATQQYELQNFKRQIADNIINEQANVKQLVQEAFNRSQSDIHIAQVFVAVAPNADSAAALKTINTAYGELKQGKDFGEVSASLSSDESIRQSKGDLGYITVFTLPYEIENIVYSLKPGTYSAPVRTKLGYHIFKNVEQRKSLGSRKVAQILIALPPEATAEQRKAASDKADSVYQLLEKGESFASLVSSVSNDLTTVPAKGELPEFSVGTYNSNFENVAFGLKRTGDISRPFTTEHGYHILKLVEIKPAPSDINDGAVYAALQEKVTRDSRLEKSKNNLIDKMMAQIKYKPGAVKEKDLIDYTDNVLHGNNVSAFKTINDSTVLFSFAKQTIRVKDWIKYAKGSQLNTEGGEGNISAFYKSFIRISADDYYRNNLADYNEDYVRQVKEFEEANLLFAIMDKNVWGKANTDTVGLQQYYNQHKEKYTWPPSADAIIVTCSSEKTASEVMQKLKSDVRNWREVTSSYGSDVIADSSRYEMTQLPAVNPANVTAATTSSTIKNQNDNTYTFTYVVNVYKDAGQRSFDDARGMVIGDYQQVLEDRWIAELKKKYPIKVNDAVFATIK